MTQNHKLQISIPTYNRVNQLPYTLNSLLVALDNVNENDRKEIVVVVYSNSTRDLLEYNALLDKYRNLFLGRVSNFYHEITGYNIGAVNNVLISVLRSTARYTWVLPDDDLASPGSIKAIVNAIDEYSPALIHGGMVNKRIVDYNVTDSTIVSSSENYVSKVVTDQKRSEFIKTQGIQLQEHVYNTKILSEIFHNQSIIECADDFLPMLLGLVCCDSKYRNPFVGLGESIGYFRSGDPNSEWRDQWAYLSLIKWKDTSLKYYTNGLTNKREYELTTNLFDELLDRNYWRPDFLLGFYGGRGLNPKILYEKYGWKYIKLLLMSPYYLIIKLSSAESVRNKVISKIANRELSAKILSELHHARTNNYKFVDYEYKVFSQCGEDGLIEYLIDKIVIENDIFVEFGVQNYQESNTRYLLENKNWSGLVFDSSDENIKYIKNDDIYWRRNLNAVCAFIDRDNINKLITDNGISGDIGLLSIDIDGNDYWVWENISSISPRIVVCEYNSLFGPDKKITVPYDKNFSRNNAHYSNLYFGASISALVSLGNTKGYAFVGSNSEGSNAFFVRRDVICDIKEMDPKDAYVKSKFRESRSKSGSMSHLSFESRFKLVSHMDVYDVHSGEIYSLGSTID